MEEIKRLLGLLWSFFASLLPSLTLPSTIGELEFLRLSKNHREFSKTLSTLGHHKAAANLLKQAETVAACWFDLGLQHLEEAKSASTNNARRSSYSRAYYAAYSASKALRYYSGGWVSLKGDDHQKAGDLPDDLPNVALLSSNITKLYEHRLLADYDNWASTDATFSLSPSQCCDLAEDFVASIRTYFKSKFGVTV